MADRGRNGVERDAEDADKRLYTDINKISKVPGLNSLPLKRDSCDLLLDAIDAQLGQLQIKPQTCQPISREHSHKDAAPLSWSQSLSKDTGFGSNAQTNDTPMSYLDLINSPEMDQTSERNTSFRDGPVTHKEMKQRLEGRIRDQEEVVSQREQVIWRLKRLLGDTFNEGRMAGESHPPSDSICTEDFVGRFRDEMVELPLPASNMQQLDREQVTQRTVISPCDDCQSEQRAHSILTTATTRRSSEDTETAHYFQRKELNCFDDSDGVKTSWSEQTGAEGRDNSPKRQGDDGSRWRSLTQAVTVMDDNCNYDTPAQEGREPRSPSGQRSPHENIQNRSPSKAQRNKRDTCRLVCSLGADEKDTDEERNPWSRRSRSERTSEKMQSDWAKMKERLSTIRQKCEKEEMTLQKKKTQIKEVELSLSELQQRRKNALQELKRLTVETAKMEKEKKTLEFVCQDSIRCQLNELQRQRESCILEHSAVMSVLERKEMERQLDNAKTELFAEQRRAREKLEAIQERLEETHEELHRVTEEESLLRNTCASLEEKHKQKKDHIEAVEFRVGKLQGELGECQIRADTQEKMLAQKELQMLDLHEHCGALQAEQDGLRAELQHIQIQHLKALKEAHEKVHRMMEAALKQQQRDLSLAHEQHVQKVNKEAEEEKANTLKEQALFFTRHIESLKSSIQLKEEEAKKLRGSVEQLQHREEELRLTTSEKVHNALEEERKKWEAEKVEAVQEHCAKLEEQNRKSLESMSSEMQREKSKALLALQHEVVELKTDSQRAALRLQQAAQAAEEEADEVNAMLEESERRHNQITAQLEQQLGHWARELGAECHHLHLLVQQTGAQQGSARLPHGPTAAEALTHLRTLREQLKHLINRLQQELDSQKESTEQLRKDKERELSTQRQQLRTDRDHALDSLKERLIQEHIEELSALNWPHMCGGGAGLGGVAESLRKQLKAKDLELRQVQRSMGQWKQQTAARLARTFEEELTAELERCRTKLLMCRNPSKSEEERQRDPEKPGGEMPLSANEAQQCVGSGSLHVVDCAASRSPSDVASLKLLRYLQSRVTQLRVENHDNNWSPSPSKTIPLELSGSYLTTVRSSFE
ncbi:trichohyalin [Clinocottus analis]|uniref:trichohyalin n=1 Tax=Clinocottus analis TaxID=304258 RepID=UPI0035C08473